MREVLARPRVVFCDFPLQCSAGHIFGFKFSRNEQRMLHSFRLIYK